MRAHILALLGVLLLVAVGALPAAAQDATPASGLADAGLPELNVTVSMAGYEGIPDQVEAGRYLVNVELADDAQFGAGIAFVQPPDGMTGEQVQVVLDEEMEAEMTGTPAVYSGLNPDEDLMPVAFTGTQSMGTSLWIVVDVPAGTHGLVCFFPDMGDGVPHAYKGMYTVIELAE